MILNNHPSLITQRTLRNSAKLSGIGLHTGSVVNMTLHPAPENTGIVFRRVDLNPVVTIPATTDYVSDTRLNTCLANGNVTVWTVEHLLSALFGLNIDNVYIDLTACEPPIMDGSALPFVTLILSAGILIQDAPKRLMRIKREITVKEGDKSARLIPCDCFKISMQIDFAHPAIAQTQQSLSLELSRTAYIEKISPARTFGFLSEYDYLRNNHLGLGAGLENTLVLDETKILNEGGLRDNAEFVKHKILDAVGDLSLLGYGLLGEFVGHKTGHALNHALRKAVLDDTTAWELVSA